MTTVRGDLNYSRPFDQSIWSDHPQVNQFNDRLYNDFLTHKQYQRKPRKNKEAKLKAIIKVLCLNLFTAWQVDPDCFTAIPSSTNAYSNNTRYRNRQITARLLFDVRAFLEASGLMILFKGYKGRVPKGGKVIRIRATPPLIRLMENDHPIKRNMITRTQNSEIIILKNKEKKYTDYKDTPNTRRMRQNLSAINQAIANTEITLKAPPDIERKIHGLLKQDTKRKERVRVNRFYPLFS